MNASLKEIAALVHGNLVGNPDLMISRLSPIDEIGDAALIFAEGSDNLRKAEQSSAAAILVASNIHLNEKSTIQVASPFKAFIHLINHFYPSPKPIEGIHPTAVVDETVQLGSKISIGPFVVIEAGAVIGDGAIIKSHVFIGRDVKIGKNTVIHPQVTLYDHTEIGDEVIIHASTVIGSDGFGYTIDGGQHLKVPHIGKVIIEANVEIGANTAIDRATLGATKIGEGTKIDNLVQIAHSVKLGKHNIVCGFTGIAGSSVSGDHVIFAADVGVSDHVRIDDGVILGARAGVPPKKHLKKGNIYLGNPARPKEKALEQELATTRIPLMRKTIKSLSEKLQHLTERLERLETDDKQ